jgi:hypothetical protein
MAVPFPVVDGIEQRVNLLFSDDADCTLHHAGGISLGHRW